MSSTLVSYSSEEEEDKGKKQTDANYDDVQMDMSDDNDEAALPSEAAMFSSKEDFNAFQKQFTSSSSSSSTQNNSEQTRSATEYGSGMAAASTDRQPRRSADNPSHHTSTSRKVDDPGEELPRNNQVGNNKDRRRDHDDSRRRGHRDGHHRREQRSRSRSRDRGQHRRRRSRSRERDDHRHRERRQSRDDDNRRFPPAFPPQRPKINNSEQERQDSRSRKLQSLGLVNTKGETLASQMEKVKEITGVEVPKYYNPAAINPLKYAEQIKKRQMLWKKPGVDDNDPQPSGSSLPGFLPATMAVAATVQVSPEKKLGSTGILAGMARQPSQSQPAAAAGSFNNWESTNLGNDKTNEKFRRLMGIKGGSNAATPSTTDSPSSVQKGSAKLFEMQEQQYEKARAITHTARGLGLGFTPIAAPTPSTSALPPPGPSSLDKRDPVSYLKK